jgi:hypothetical protein
MDKEEAAGEGLFSLKPVGCFWKAFFLVDFGNPPVDAKKDSTECLFEKKVNAGSGKGVGNARARFVVCHTTQGPGRSPSI